MPNRQTISTLIIALAGSLAALICGSAEAASLTFNDLNDGTIDISTGQFEGGFTVNGAQIAPSGPAGSVSGSILGVSEADGPITFSGTWIDLGQATKGSRTIYLVDPADISLVRDIFAFTVSDAGGSRATISGTWTSSLSGPLGPIPAGTSAGNIRVEDGSNIGFSYAFLGARARSLPDPDPVATNDNFSIVIIPDTQIYVEENPEIFEAQIQWILDNEGPDEENIVYVAHLGDLKDNPGCDNLNISNGSGDERFEWDIVDQAFARLDAARGGAGIPYGVVPGNHDFDQVVSNGTAGCPTFDCRGGVGNCTIDQRPLGLYNDNFGPTRFALDPWYGDPVGVGNSGAPTRGNFRDNSNEDNFILFDGTCGIKFIAINLAYKEGADPLDRGLERLGDEEVFWADGILKEYDDRLGIITSHYFMNQNRSIPFNTLGGYGQRVYDGLTNTPNPNLLMMLSAHKRGEAWLQNTSGRGALPPVQILLSDYQSVEYPANPAAADFDNLTSITNGGNGGFIRIMRFDTAAQMVNVETFSPPATFADENDIPYTYDDGSPPPADRDLLVSDFEPTSGDQMNANTASNFSFSFAGYVADSTCAAP